MSRAGTAFVIIAFISVLACQKNNLSTSESSAFISSNDSLLDSSSYKDSLSYSDSIFSASVTGNEKKVYPVSRPSQPGYFAASLPGLDLDSVSGRINISKSESGLRYQVYYLSMANELIDSTPIIITGIDYQDRIYDVASDLPEELIAVPIYNMAPGLPLPCTNGSNGQGCKFDETDLNSDSIPDIIGANNSKLIIDTTTGIIDLKKSLDAGVFGSPPLGNPVAMNGRKRDISIYYSLGEGSTRTLKRITVRLVYFNSRALIPESMIKEVASRNERYQVNGPSETTSSLSLTSSFSYYTLTSYKPKRPPLIIIVSGR